MPYKFPHWKVEGKRLYCDRPNSVTNQVFLELEAWKLVLPHELRIRAPKEAHNSTISSHVGVEKTHARLALLY